MRIPYTKASAKRAIQNVAQGNFVLNENIDVICFRIGCDTFAEARSQALIFVTSMIRESTGKKRVNPILAEDVLAEADYSRYGFGSHPDYNFRWIKTFTRSDTPLVLPRDLAHV